MYGFRVWGSGFRVYLRFIEYYFVDYNTKCVLNCPNTSAYPFADSWCGDLANNRDCWCSRGEKLQAGLC